MKILDIIHFTLIGRSTVSDHTKVFQYHANSLTQAGDSGTSEDVELIPS